MSEGFINVLKPPGMTSHDVVAWVRRLLGVRRVGHAGTLDPPAAGVLVVALGRATRLVGYLPGVKTYRGEITFGVSTTTLDGEGEVVRRAPCRLTQADLEQVLPKFRGDIEQIPPMVSAVHYRGRRLYELARTGLDVDRPRRRVHIARLEVLAFTPHPEHPRALIECECSSGTYVRALAADIGRALGTEAYLSFLLRTASGPFAISSSLTLEELEEAVRGGDRDWLCPPEAGLGHLPTLVLDRKATRLFRHGNAVEVPAGTQPAPGLRFVVRDDTLTFLGVGRLSRQGEDWMLQPEVVFS
ncbi:MAG: tRNA pseudouridine55 synthase [Bacillota bacterium]|nr:tRNA pseudouridine55 synthase [Bacillota bacterium]MDK2855537.1 tRNA pseudouridine55 synthase [Bacillota bacterium]MDK2925476.1 tRNA pseudouridine55 synthase [Bacillota bacterium]